MCMPKTVPVDEITNVNALSYKQCQQTIWINKYLLLMVTVNTSYISEL